MTSAFMSLVAAAIVWVAVHIGVAGTRLRERIVARIGERAFRGLFVLASFAILGWLGWSFGAAGPVRVLWHAPQWLSVLMMFSIGTAPQMRESFELLRLSPITNT